MDARSSEAVAAGARRYKTAAIWLHWVIAGLIVIQLCLGWTMNELLPDRSPTRATLLQLHITVGLTILLLVLIRIAVRLIYRAPPLPAAMPLWERALARATHLLFYGLMLVMPLTGWALVSLGTKPTRVWGVTLPHLPGVGLLFGPAPPHAVRHSLSHVHVYILVWILLINLALHVAGALKHQFDGSPVLWRMTWMRPPARRTAVSGD